MHIQHVEISNFRKLKAVRIDFSEQKTVFVGANNSGKTSAMVALRRFLVEPSEFTVNDLTLSHWTKINASAAGWESAVSSGEELAALDWSDVLPFLDVWLNVSNNELHYVQKLLPTLDWQGGHLGVRLRLEPKDAEGLQREYLKARAAITELLAHPLAAASVVAVAEGAAEVVVEAVSVPSAMPAYTFSLWPQSMMEFLGRRLRSMFTVRAYLLDPAALKAPQEGLAVPQVLAPDSDPLDGDPFKGLICIDEISAQRGFGYAGSTRAPSEDDSKYDPQEARGAKKLSSQLRSYYTQHLDPYDKPEPKDLTALQALHDAEAAFEARLTEGFAAALKELEHIGYPGVTDPKLTITTRIKPTDGLNHGSAVQYEVPTHLAEAEKGHRLPEDSNGLGYQNLVSMVFALMSFRDRWMRVGKAGISVADDDSFVPPLHLILVEEPEAHLHAQVQQVFIKQAYAVLRKHPKLGDATALKTQLVVSTHSSHLAHECDFASLRYFRRLPAPTEAGGVPIASVVNLSEVFGAANLTEQFVTRYLKAVHCDLFFADGAVLIEGPAERILVPHFVRERPDFEYLRRCYITWLEIGGSHAHRLKRLLEHLGLTTLIVTDLDAKDGTSGAALPPKRNSGQKARNETLKSWVPAEDSLDVLLDKMGPDLVKEDPSGYAIRVAYQQPIALSFKSKSPAEALANTFEDALLYENPTLFADLPGHGLIAKFRDALADSADMEALAAAVHLALKSGNKAEFALDLLYSDKITSLKVPVYIHDGLAWLALQLKRKEQDAIGQTKAAA
ncbi:AAA family ATPase [Hydrogenophaga palleronii]|uniref:AAA family ATPase n=1 Tax=Hydrogenophaga palleronii TaxID=65655 RepID=UPI0008245663|nr:AAA family ATPase [Hydrogenophaga palleronii]